MSTDPSTIHPEVTQHILTDTAAALDALIEAVRALPEGAEREPSALPGWTRGHVLGHVAGNGRAQARQAEHAARGETVEYYDGGPAGRDAEIEADSTLSVAQHVAALEAVRERHAVGWPVAGAPLWAAPVAYRNGVLHDCLFAWWRELRIHSVDALVGIGFDSWDDELCGHLLAWLAPRLPEGVTVAPEPAPTGQAGQADVAEPTGTVVAGDLRDVVAWLAGREPERAPRAVRNGTEVPLPELLPWP
ncbi:maleylpyruvate isomerase family mycothiol-dependent enzyme [Antribacter gilvus]|uniref:maleylpyruvate isomerase family mycothiol-dependent enzyme n=1 Tax=Antribacter gilvus TaxID=2304675 RepID=UPI000F7A3BC2|nr:maleylpyruvate isomerase family mycothiol-dependent enzyme [Antribacter gilvus]